MTVEDYAASGSDDDAPADGEGAGDAADSGVDPPVEERPGDEPTPDEAVPADPPADDAEAPA
jgi:hypothetical protein